MKRGQGPLSLQNNFPESFSSACAYIPSVQRIKSVTVIPEERSSSHGRNWKVAFVVDGAGLAPAKAFAIAIEVAMEFDLST